MCFKEQSHLAETHSCELDGRVHMQHVVEYW